MTFEFEIEGALPNWLNKGWRPNHLHAERKKWRRLAHDAILTARCRGATYRRAIKGEQRRVAVVHYRVHKVDTEAERGLAKPIIDQMCARYQIWIARQPRKTAWVDGEALIYDDDERHLPPKFYVVEQVRVPHYRDQHVAVRVEGEL